jgi:hypothetical protein
MKRPTLLPLVLLGAGLSSASSAQAPANSTFPAVTAQDLNKREVHLPSGLGGRLNLVLIAFLQKQQKDVDTWLPSLPALTERHPSFAYYELPVISRMNPFVRWFINNGMRGGIPDRNQRGRTITLYLDKKPFREALGIPSEDTIYAFLLNQSGEVVWRAERTADEKKLRSLQEYLNAH